MNIQRCAGRLEEPVPGEMSCSFGDACAVAGLIEGYVSGRDETLGELARSSHIDRGAPDWLTDEPF